MKGLFIALTASIAALSFYGYKKVKDYQFIFDNLVIKPFDVADINLRGLSLNNIFGGGTTMVKFKLKLKIKNPTDINLTANTLGLITINRVFISDNLNQIIATADVNRSEISIPANNEIISNWLSLELPLENIVGSLINQFDPNQFKYKISINISGVGNFIAG
jgi:hypothetical protein